jgi:hypothetical protein
VYDPGGAWLAWEEERSYQAGLLRDVFGNPLRPVAVDPAWRAWGERVIRGMVQAIYDGRAFDRMPVLADALSKECGRCRPRQAGPRRRRSGREVAPVETF